MLLRGFLRSFLLSVSSLFIILAFFRFSYHPTSIKIVPLNITRPAAQDIPRNIWQVFLGYSEYEGLGKTIQSWVKENQDYSYFLVSKDGAEDFVKEYYAERPDIVKTFMDVQFPIFRADLLRYMLLEAKGGIYSDLDTTVLKPIRDWVPHELHEKTRAIVGIEFDQLNETGPSHGFTEHISFCQWTLASTPGHFMMKKIVEEVVKRINQMAHQSGATLASFQVPDNRVGDVTGPGIWTRVVMESLAIATMTNVTYRNITGLKQPQLFGDILILPINGFGSGQGHSGSTMGNNDAALIKHHFKMWWRKDKWGS